MSAVLQSPTERLAHSREQLRLSLHDAAPAANDANVEGRPAARRRWFDELRANPGVSLVAGAVGHWWSRHPMRVAGTLAARAATVAIHPVAQRHPLALLAGAFVVGGLLAWSRPWRWPRAALWTGVLPQLLLAAVRAAPARPDRPDRPPTTAG